jgi:5'-nucleotidase
MMGKRGRLTAIATAALTMAAVSATAVDAAPGRGAGTAPKADVVPTLLHNNDGESALFESEGSDGQSYGGIAPFASVVGDLKASATTGPPAMPGAKRVELTVSSGDNFLAGAAFQASLDNGVPYYDAIGMSLIGYDASAIGNHEFDFGPDVFRDFVTSFSPPLTFVSANLDVSQEPDLQALADSGQLADSVVVKERGERFGIVGATTEALATISSPRNVIVEAVAPAVQAEVDSLLADGVDKIILIAHLQSLNEDLALLEQLDGIDVAVAGGGDELLANPDDLLIPGDTAAGAYPTIGADASGNEVPVVTTSGGYRYVGRLVVSFDKAGNVLDVLDDSGPVRVTTGASNPDAVEPDPAVQTQVVDPVAEFVSDLADTPAGVTETPLDSRRGAVTSNGSITVDVRGERVGETNLGDLATDAYMATATALAPDFGIDAPDLAITNGGGIRRPDDVIFPTATPGSPETLSRLDVNNQFPFPNFLTVSEDVPAATLKGLLENAVSNVQNVDGRFAQVSNLVYRWDSTRTAEDRDGGTCELFSPGDRVTYIALNPGNTADPADDVVLYDDGWVVDESTYTVDIASIDFLSIGGGDCYDFGGAETTRLGVLYGQAVENFIADDLGGVISAADYAFEGTARIQQVN